MQDLLANDIPLFRNRIAVTLPDYMGGVQKQVLASFTMVEVFFETLNVITIKQSPMFDVRI